jgi:hypothetical protein
MFMCTVQVTESTVDNLTVRGTVDIFKKWEGITHSIHINTPSLLRQFNHDHICIFFNI